jgi:hypothetical protein
MSSKEGNKNGAMRNFYFFSIFLIVGIVIKILSIQNLPFDSDQAVVGIMGKHILEGAFPWLYYGDSYCGILEPLLAAWSFLFLGVSRLNLHLIPCIFSILFLISIYQLGREIFNREIALLGMLLAAVPFFSMGYYSSLAYGGYVEILWLGNLILLITHRLALGEGKISLPILFFLGVLWGIAWWTYPISAVYLATSGFFLLVFRIDTFLKGKVLTVVPGFFLGSLPFWIWNGSNQFPFLTFSSSQENPNYTYRVERFFREFIEFFNPGLQQYFTPTAVALAATFLGSLILLFITYKKQGRQFPSGRGSALLLLFFLFFILFYIGSRFSEQNASRYLLPLYSILPLSLALMAYVAKARSPGLYLVLVFLLFSAQTYHQLSLRLFLKQDFAAYQKKLEVEHNLFDFLRQKNQSYVYVPEYWSAAELTFNALENPAFCLPFKDRYPLNTMKADAVTNPAFVLDGKYPGSFEQMFRSMGGTYSKEIVSIYHGVKGYVVYYNFRPPAVQSQEILPLDWKAKSSHNADTENRAFDRNRSSSWSTSLPQQPGMFYQIDLTKQYSLNRLVILCSKGREWDFPAYFKVEISGDERNWNEITSVNNNWAYLFWSGGRPFWKLRDGRIEINFPTQEARYIRITLTAAAPQHWSIGEIFVYQAVKGRETTAFNFSELVSFLSLENIKYVYADIGLSAQLTEFSRGTIKCLQDDYDITYGGDYSRWGYNGAFPYFNKLKKQVDFSLSPAFVVAKETSLSFIRTLDRLNLTYSVKIFGDQIVYYGFKISGPTLEIRNRKGLESFYWTGTHLLDNN